MFTSKDYDLNKEYCNRQMKKSEHQQQVDTIQQDVHRLEPLHPSFTRLMMIILLTILCVFLFVLSSMPTHAQNAVDNFDSGDDSHEEPLSIDMILSVMSLKNGKAENALAIIDGVVENIPDVAAAYTLRSAIQLALGDYGQALLDGETALKLDETEIAAYFFMGHAAFSQKRYELARTYYTVYLSKIAEEIDYNNDLVIYLVGSDDATLIEELIAMCDQHLVVMNR